MTNVYGYVRVSTRSQNYDTQVEHITNYCKMKEFTLINIFADKASGKNVERNEYQKMISVLESNPQQVSAIVVTKIDRLGRSLRDLLKFVDWCKEHKIEFVALQNSIDTTVKEGRLFLYIMGALAEYERELIAERTEEGMTRYLANGGKVGKKKIKLPLDEIKRLVDEGVPKTEVGRRLRISKGTVYRRLYDLGYKFEKEKRT